MALYKRNNKVTNNLIQNTQDGNSLVLSPINFVHNDRKDTGINKIETLDADGNAVVSITQTQIAAPVITRDGSVVQGEHIAPASITTDQIAAGTIKASNIEAGTITTSELAFTPVTGDNVVATVNASAEGITIDADKLTLTGVLAVGGAASDVNSGVTTIDGDHITAGTISTTELDFTPVTGSDVIASINASAEGITIDAANVDLTGKVSVTGSAADVNAGTTTIDGGKITASTVTADKIDVSNLASMSSDLGSATAGSLVVGSGSKIWINDSADGKIAVGGTDKTIAPFQVNSDGSLNATSATITGSVTTQDGSVLHGSYIVNQSVDYSALDVASFSSLSAITANMGDMTSGTITLDNSGHIKGGQTDFDTGTGFFLGNSAGEKKFSIGNATNSLTWNGAALKIKGKIETTNPLNLKSYTTATLPTGGTETAAKVPSSASPNGLGGFGDGSDGDLHVTNGQYVSLSPDHKYQYNSITVDQGGTLSVSYTNYGSVMYLLCKGSCVINGSLQTAYSSYNGQNSNSVILDGITYTSPSVANGGSGGAGAGTHGGSGGSQGLGFGGGGGGGYAETVIQGWAAAGNGANGGSGYGAGGASVHLDVVGKALGISSSNSSSGGSGSCAVDNIYGFAWSGQGAYAGGSGYDAYSYEGSSNGSAAGGGGGGGGYAGMQGLHLVIKAESITLGATGVINTSGTNGGAGGLGGAPSYTGSGSFATTGGRGGGGGGGNAGNVKLYYTNTLTNSGTVTMAAGTGGAGASSGSNGASGTLTTTPLAITNPTNVYASDNTYATCAADSGKITIFVSKDGGANWSSGKEQTYTSSEGYKDFGDSGDTWGYTLTGADINSNTNFMVRVQCGTATTYQQDYSGFNFSQTAGNSVVGLKVQVEAKYVGGVTSIDHLRAYAYMANTDDNIIAGSTAYDSTLGTITVNDGSNEWVPLIADGNAYPNPPVNVMRMTGEITQWSAKVAPSGWMTCDGSAIARSTYSALASVIMPVVGDCTISIATPGVVTLAGHGLSTGDAIFLTTTGALPTGLSANTIYYVVYVNSTTFSLATTFANAHVPTKIATSGSQSGVHTLTYCPYGLGNGSSTFNIPDLRGRTAVGYDVTQAEFDALGIGANVGEKTHTLTTTELAAHAHNRNYWKGNSFGTGDWVSGTYGNPAFLKANGWTSADYSSDNAGGGGAHNNIQPYLSINYIIKT